MEKGKKIISRVPGIFWGVIFVSILFSITTENFTKFRNIENLLRNTSILLIISIGGTMAILAGKIDLSIGGIATLSGMVAAIYLHSIDNPGVLNVVIAILISLTVGSLVGIFNGFMIGIKNYDNWLITFSSMSISFGLAQVITGGNIVSGFNKTVRYIGNGKIGQVSVLLIITAVVTGIMIFVIRNTRFGMHIYAVGDSEQCAALSGVNVQMTLFWIYTLSGFFAGLCGFLLLSRTNSVGPTTGDGYEFNAIAAIIVGGTTFDGGKGGLGGTVLGALFIAIVKNGLQLINMSIYWQQAFVGIFVLCIILIDVLGERRKVTNAMRRVYHE